jgi:hypothetical protein
MSGFNPENPIHGVLLFLREDPDLCYSFQVIMYETGLTREQVRHACQRLRRMQYTRFVRGLMTDEGQFAGSGYGATNKEGWP